MSTVGSDRAARPHREAAATTVDVRITDTIVDVGGYPLHAVEWDPPGATATPPIVLVHGLGGSTVSWDAVGAELASASGRTVVAVDLPGFGQTRAVAEDVDGRRYVRLLRALVESRGGHAVLVGNSMGGALAVALAAGDPALVEALVLVDTALPLRPPRLDRLPALAWQGVRFAVVSIPGLGPRIYELRNRRLGARRTVDATLTLVTAEHTQIEPGQRARLVSLARERFSYPEAAIAHVRAARWILAYTGSRMRTDLDRIERPVLALHGRHDALVPIENARRLAGRRDVTFVELDCGHVPQMELPETFTTTVSAWLAQQST